MNSHQLLMLIVWYNIEMTANDANQQKNGVPQEYIASNARETDIEIKMLRVWEKKRLTSVSVSHFLHKNLSALSNDKM